MTGQVKEEILTRFGELGLFVDAGVITFHPNLLFIDEMTTSSSVFRYIDVSGTKREIELSPGSLAFTFCQIPVVYCTNAESNIEIHYADGTRSKISGNVLDPETCQHLFNRNGQIDHLIVGIKI